MKITLHTLYEHSNTNTELKDILFYFILFATDSFSLLFT